jgi:hypothetical protein
MILSALYLSINLGIVLSSAGAMWGYDSVWLHVGVLNSPAQALYRKAGFKVVNEGFALAGPLRQILLSKDLPTAGSAASRPLHFDSANTRTASVNRVMTGASSTSSRRSSDDGVYENNGGSSRDECAQTGSHPASSKTTFQAPETDSPYTSSETSSRAKSMQISRQAGSASEEDGIVFVDSAALSTSSATSIRTPETGLDSNSSNARAAARSSRTFKWEVSDEGKTLANK